MNSSVCSLDVKMWNRNRIIGPDQLPHLAIEDTLWCIHAFAALKLYFIFKLVTYLYIHTYICGLSHFYAFCVMRIHIEEIN